MSTLFFAENGFIFKFLTFLCFFVENHPQRSVQNRLTEITERMKFLRKEVRLCGGIEARNDTLKEKLTTIRADEQQGKELMTNEHRRRSGRTNGPNELGGL